MKRIILLIALVSSLFAVDGNLSDRQVSYMQELVKFHGYSCERVIYASQSGWTGKIRLQCNKYVYEIKDIGGRWTVKVN